MTGLRFYLFLAALCSCSVLGFGEVALPETKLVDVSPSQQVPVGPVEPVEPVSVVEKETTISEVDPTTSPDVKPDNTTTSSTTSTTSTTTTTTTTTTTPPPPPPAPTPAPPTPAPAPLPAPEQGSWNFTGADNVTCILVQFAAQITLNYSSSVNSKATLANVTMNVPANASVLEGSCNASATEQWLKIGWLSATNAPNSLLLVFRKNDTTKSYALQTFNLTVDASQLVNSTFKTDTVVFSHGEEWSTGLATSYKCTPITRISANNDTASASVAVSRLQEEAFRTAHGSGFSVARECGGGDVPDAVPVAVGCALGALVLVVLVAYLLARRRSAARGYLSM